MPFRFVRPIALAALLAIIPARNLKAQVPSHSRSAMWVGTPLDEYVRLLQLTGEVPLASRMLRPLEFEARTLTLADSSSLSRNPWRAIYGSRQFADTGRLSLERYEPIVRISGNSAVPFGANDGAMWAGKGLSAIVELGAAARYGPLTIRFAPNATWSQNKSFELGETSGAPAGSSIYVDPLMGYKIDMPQRFGDEPVKNVSWGQSGVQLNTHGVRTGVSNENMWWGPGIENSLLMSNNAPGFAHGFIGTEHPLDIYVGSLEALYTIGRLQQSDYFRIGIADSLTKRWMNALGVVIEPRGAPGLYLGAMRVFYAYVPASGLGLHDVTEIFQPFTKSSLQTADNPTGDDRQDQMLSVFTRWVLPTANFEVYGEFGRNDHNVDFRDEVLEPEHASAWLLGAQKLWLHEQGFLRMGIEATSLGSALTQFVRPSPTWYAHGIVTQGYTQRGQVIGAAVGPGGQSQSIRLDWYRRWGSVGGYLHRQRENDDAYYAHFRTYGNRNRHDVFMGFGLRGNLLLKCIDVSVTLLKQREYNRYFVLQNDVSNLHLETGVQLRLP